MRPDPDRVAPPSVPAKPPVAVMAARVMLALGAVVLLLIAYTVYLEAGPGQSAEATGRAAVYAVPAIFMVTIAVVLGRGRQVVRWLVVVGGAFMLFFGLGDLGQGRLLDGLLLTIFAFGVIVYVNRRAARAWFRRLRGAP